MPFVQDNYTSTRYENPRARKTLKIQPEKQLYAQAHIDLSINNLYVDLL